MKLLNQLDKTIIQEWFDYSPKTGRLFWKKSPGRRVHAGDEAGSISTNHYRVVQFQSKNYLVHILIWIFHYGYVPNGFEVDHIDHKRLNNKVINFRLVSCLENNHNKSIFKNNTSGHTGIYYDYKINKWRVQIEVLKKGEKRKNTHIGSFECIEDAIEARKKAEVKYGFHKNHGSERENVPY